MVGATTPLVSFSFSLSAYARNLIPPWMKPVSNHQNPHPGRDRGNIFFESAEIINISDLIDGLVQVGYKFARAKLVPSCGREGQLRNRLSFMLVFKPWDGTTLSLGQIESLHPLWKSNCWQMTGYENADNSLGFKLSGRQPLVNCGEYQPKFTLFVTNGLIMVRPLKLKS